MSKALNFNEGKPRPSLILKDLRFAFHEMLKVREFGCKKYDRLNALLSVGTDDAEEFLDDNFDSVHRHLDSVAEGKHVDAESDCYHWAQIAIRAMFALQYLEPQTPQRTGEFDES
jgi:hypothetical protein